MRKGPSMFTTDAISPQIFSICSWLNPMGQKPLIQSPRIFIHTTAQVCEEINTNTSNINCRVVADFNSLPYLHPFLLFSLLNNRKIICCFDFNRKSNTELLFWRTLEGGHSQGDEGGLEGDVSPVRVELKDTVLSSLDRRKVIISRMRIWSPYSRWFQHAPYEHGRWTLNTFNVNDTWRWLGLEWGPQDGTMGFKGTGRETKGVACCSVAPLDALTTWVPGRRVNSTILSLYPIR